MTYRHLLMKNKDEDKNSYFIEFGNYLLDGCETSMSNILITDFTSLKQKINQGIILYNQIKTFFDECGDGWFIYSKEEESFNIYDMLFDISRYPINQIRDEFLTSDFITIIYKIFKLTDLLFNDTKLFKIIEDMADNEYNISDFKYYEFSEDKYSYIKEIIPNFYVEHDKVTGEEFQSDLLNLSFISDEDAHYEDISDYGEKFEFKHYRFKEF